MYPVVFSRVSRKFLVAVLTVATLCFLAACGGGSSTPPPPPTAPSITTQPTDQSAAVGATATFTVTASGTAPLSYQWQKGSSNISGGTSASYTTPPTTMGDDQAQFKVVVSNSEGTVTSNPATLSVTTATASIDVLTYHYDVARTGANTQETALTTANVNQNTFGKIDFFDTDGKVDAQPLYLSQLAIPSNGTHNVLYVVTEHDTVYAFDADSGTVLWQKSMLGSGENPSDAVNGCGQVSPEIGITATPVIDRSRGPHGAIYLVAMSKSGSNYFQRLHALDVATGEELFSGPTTITATFPGTGAGSSGGTLTFAPKQYEERAALTLINNTVYTMWTSHCDDDPYTGWIIGFDASTLLRNQVLNVTPNGSRGAIWMAGDGPAADPSGNLYFLDGNGDFGTSLDGSGFPSNKNYGNGFIKLSTSGTLAVADYFNMSNTVGESNSDLDLGSGGAIVLPDFTDSGSVVRHLAVGAGKDQIIYVVNREDMGKFHATDVIYQKISGALSGAVFSKPSYFNNTVYYGPVSTTLKAFPISNAMLATTASSHSSGTFTYPGTTPAISANGTTEGIVWAVENSNPAVLHAYNASNLATELYNSNQAGSSRDHFGNGNKFITPMIVNGNVFVGTQDGVAVFGLLP